MSATKRSRVCLFGLSADPPTGVGGHVGIVQALSRQGTFDEIRVIPVYRHTFNDKRQRLVSFEHRMNMCRLAFDGIPKTIVSDAEYQSWRHAVDGLSEDEANKVSVGTASLLDYLKMTEDNHDFFFCLGADAFLDLTAGKWKESVRVLHLLEGRLVVFHRAVVNDAERFENDLQDRLNAMPTVKLLRIDELKDISSSQVRACRDEGKLKQMVVPMVLQYIKDNRLYQFSHYDAA